VGFLGLIWVGDGVGVAPAWGLGGAGRWTARSVVLSAGARKGATPPALEGARGGPSRLHGCGQRGGASFDADGSTDGARAEHGSRARLGREGGGRP
jgi:hypothetical protein